MSNGVFNFNFLALLLSEILGGPKFKLGGPMPPGRPLMEKFLYPKRLLVFNFNILALVVSEILGVPNLRWGALCPPVRPLAENFLYPRRVLYYV